MSGSLFFGLRCHTAISKACRTTSVVIDQPITRRVYKLIAMAK